MKIGEIVLYLVQFLKIIQKFVKFFIKIMGWDQFVQFSKIIQKCVQFYMDIVIQQYFINNFQKFSSSYEKFSNILNKFLRIIQNSALFFIKIAWIVQYFIEFFNTVTKFFMNIDEIVKMCSINILNNFLKSIILLWKLWEFSSLLFNFRRSFTHFS